MTQAFIEELGEGHTIGTLNHLYEGFNDLNEYWIDAPASERAALTARIKGSQSSLLFSDKSTRLDKERLKNNLLKPQ